MCSTGCAIKSTTYVQRTRSFCEGKNERGSDGMRPGLIDYTMATYRQLCGVRREEARGLGWRGRNKVPSARHCLKVSIRIELQQLHQ